MKIIAIIPARFASTRFPGKALEMLGNESIVQRVYNQAAKCNLVHEIRVATDDQRIYDHVSSWGGKVVMTAADHPSGTDRCLEAFEKTGYDADVLINLQGDEPFLDPAAIEELIALFADSSCEIATLVRPVKSEEELFNPSCVKAVLDKNGYALYFSRHAIPYQRNATQNAWIKHHSYYAHMGIYGFRPTVLKAVCALPPSALEMAESLEQLRWLENGYRIKSAVTTRVSMGIDTPADLEKARQMIS